MTTRAMLITGASYTLLLCLFGTTPAQERLFPDDAVINVKTAYGAVGDGITDDTAALQAAITANVGNERTIYFPNGTYLVSNRLEWRRSNGEWAAALTFQGQSRTGVVIKLMDAAPGFTDPAVPRAVIHTASQPGGPYNATNGGGYNAFNNHIADLTVDTGSSNPGAIGIDHVGNNTSSIRDVTIRSADGQGQVGLAMYTRYATGPCLIKNVSVEGFDFGIRSGIFEYSQTFEHITLSNQKIAGIFNENNVLSIRDLQSSNTVPAIRNVGDHGLITIIDSDFTSGSPDFSAIDNQRGRLFARGITTSGYQSAINNRGTTVAGASVTEFTSDAAQSLFASPQQSLNLPIEETPEFHDNDLANWVNVRDYGATPGDGIDDTAAIQAAIDAASAAGKTTIYFPKGSIGRYHISNTIYVRGGVKRIWGNHNRLIMIGTGFDNASAPRTLFKVETENDVFIEGFVFNDYQQHHPGLICFEHATAKRLTLRGLISWWTVSAVYRATAGAGDLFSEDTSHHANGIGHFFRPGQRVWMRQFDSEGIRAKATNSGATLWVLGIKTEGGGPIINTSGGGKTELLGGLLYVLNNVPVTTPAFTASESSVSLVYGESAYNGVDVYKTHVSETRDGVTKTLARADIPTVRMGGRTLVLYTGYKFATTPIPAPSDLAAEPGSGSVTLRWADNSANEDGFKIERSIDGVNFTQVALVNQNTTTYADAPLVGSTTYYHRIRAYNADNDSPYSDTASATTLPSPPLAPTNLTTRASTREITLQWADNSLDETGFKVERSMNGSDFTETATLPANSTNTVTHTDANLTPAMQYFYRVLAINNIGNSPYSNTVRAVTAASSQAVPSTADAFVRDGQYAAINYGTDAALNLKLDPVANSGFTRWSYLKFDLTDANTLDNVRLRLYGGLGSANGANIPTAVYGVADTTWAETSITWANKPATGATALATVTVPDATPRWYEWDVTAYTRAERAAGRGTITLALKNTSGASPVTIFNTREATSNQPQLFITIDATLVDVSGQAHAESSGLVYNRLSRTYNGTITVTNTSAQPMPSSLHIVLSNMTAGVTLDNRSGTHNGSPYRTTAPNVNALAPGESVGVPVQFTKPAGAEINYTVVVFSGTMPQ